MTQTSVKIKEKEKPFKNYVEKTTCNNPRRKVWTRNLSGITEAI